MDGGPASAFRATPLLAVITLAILAALAATARAEVRGAVFQDAQFFQAELRKRFALSQKSLMGFL